MLNGSAYADRMAGSGEIDIYIVDNKLEKEPNSVTNEKTWLFLKHVVTDSQKLWKVFKFTTRLEKLSAFVILLSTFYIYSHIMILKCRSIGCTWIGMLKGFCSR